MALEDLQKLQACIACRAKDTDLDHVVSPQNKTSTRGWVLVRLDLS
jgi:hypothetical protein